MQTLDPELGVLSRGKKYPGKDLTNFLSGFQGGHPKEKGE